MKNDRKMASVAILIIGSMLMACQFNKSIVMAAEGDCKNVQ